MREGQRRKTRERDSGNLSIDGHLEHVCVASDQSRQGRIEYVVAVLCLHSVALARSEFDQRMLNVVSKVDIRATYIGRFGALSH